MSQRLRTPWAHKLITSPLGALMDTHYFEALKDRSLPKEFRLSRVGAAAAASVGTGVEAFLQALGSPLTLSPRQNARLAQALEKFEVDWQTRAAAIAQWEDLFWGTQDVPMAARVACEEQRRAASQRCLQPQRTLGFLASEATIPPVKCDIPTPEQVFDTWSAAIAQPSKLYGAPAYPPPIERSRFIQGPTGTEYWLRFPSPSPHFDDWVYARVVEPEDPNAISATLIYGSGLGMAYDQIRYWPEEDYMARPLAQQGIRVVLIESPWHGRRRAHGYFSGEPYLGTAPEGLFKLYAAQVQETACLVAWAREQGSPTVGVGGISLGGIVAQQVAGWCGTWPASMRPDCIALGATSTHIDEVVLQSTITTTLKVNQAVQAAGWTPERLQQLHPLLDPPAEVGVAPENIVAVLGQHDQYVPYRWAREMLETWEVPAANIITWDKDHFGVLVRFFRETTAQELIVDVLKRCNRKMTNASA